VYVSARQKSYRRVHGGNNLVTSVTYMLGRAFVVHEFALLLSLSAFVLGTCASRACSSIKAHIYMCLVNQGRRGEEAVSARIAGGKGQHAVGLADWKAKTLLIMH
jgi:hypothetical protein